MQGKTVDSWKERLPEIVQGCEIDNIWNMDETGLFRHALPERGFGQKSNSWKEEQTAAHHCLLCVCIR